MAVNKMFFVWGVVAIMPLVIIHALAWKVIEEYFTLNIKIAVKLMSINRTLT